jgi:LacI family transcriptional regulator
MNKRKSFVRVTLADIAEESGFSRSTVSLVLRGSPLISDETRRRVYESAGKLGYVYNRAAASLRTQRSHTIGLVVTDITNPFFAEMTVAIEAELDKANYTVLLSNTSEQVAKQARFLRMLQEYGVDGILICPANGTGVETIERLHNGYIPIVQFTRHLAMDADYVGADNPLGAAMAVEHLLSHGHRRIAFIGGPGHSSARRERLQGYHNAFRRFGLQADEKLSVTTPVTRDGGYEAILELLAQPHPPTAALCYNDIVAFGVLLGLRAAGRTPGVDFAVIGFDNIAEAALQRPGLTTVSVTPRQIGMQAAQLLLERIQNPDAALRQILLPPALVIRESCGSHAEPSNHSMRGREEGRKGGSA